MFRPILPKVYGAIPGKKVGFELASHLLHLRLREFLSDLEGALVEPGVLTKKKMSLCDTSQSFLRLATLVDTAHAVPEVFLASHVLK